MKKLIFATLTFVFLSFFANAWAQTADDNQSAQTLIQNWFSALKAGDSTKAAAFLAPQFVSIHTDGIIRNKAQEMDLIKRLHMKSFDLTNFSFSQSGDVMIVTYVDKGDEMIDNKLISPKATGRMAILQKQNGQWVILAYANTVPIGH